MVGADKGGVGKTMMTRCIVDYIKQRKIEGDVRLFDTESPKGVLRRFYNEAEVIDLEKTNDQMRVLDNIVNNITVVDIKAGLLTPTLQMFSKIGLLDAVRQNQVKLVIFHILGSNIASLNEVMETIQIINGAKYFLVKNHTNDSKFFEWDSNISSALTMAPMLDIPQLTEMACEYVDQAGVPFSGFIEDSANSFVLKGNVRHWLNKVFDEFDRVKLKEFLNPVE